LPEPGAAAAFLTAIAAIAKGLQEVIAVIFE
jgi:hypothetical protein